MFIIQEARLAKNQKTLAEEILKIANTDQQIKFSECLDNAFRHREVSLNFKWEQMQDKIRTQQQESVAELEAHVDSLKSLLDVKSEKAVLEFERALEESKQAETDLKHKLNKDLKEMRARLESVFNETMEQERDNFRRDSDRIQECRADYLRKYDEVSMKHYTNITELHQRGEGMLESYFKALMDRNSNEIKDLDSRIASLKQEIASQAAEISNLHAKNAIVSRPLEELEARKRILEEKLEVVDTGTMAYRNFKTSVSMLSKKLEMIERQISEIKTS
jgi:predicted RNase H-like nuclease (RuvC/YqgF family)